MCLDRVGQWYFNLSNHHARIVSVHDPLGANVQIFEDADIQHILGAATYVGDFYGDDHAKPYLTAAGDVYLDDLTDMLRVSLTFRPETDNVVGMRERFLRLATGDDVTLLRQQSKNNADSVTIIETTLTGIRNTIANYPAFPGAPAEGSRNGKIMQYVGNALTWIANSGGGGSSFSPSKANLYAAVKSIFHPSTNAGVAADDTNMELDVSGVSIAKVTNPNVDAVASQTNKTNLDSIGATARAALNDTAYVTVRKVVRLLDRILKLATTSTAGIIALARNAEYDNLNSADNTRAMTVYGFRRMLGSSLNSKAEQSDLDAEETARENADTRLEAKIDEAEDMFDIDPNYWVLDDAPRTIVGHFSADLLIGVTRLIMTLKGRTADAPAQIVENRNSYDFLFSSAATNALIRDSLRRGHAEEIQVIGRDGSNVEIFNKTTLIHPVRFHPSRGLRLIAELPSTNQAPAALAANQVFTIPAARKGRSYHIFCLATYAAVGTSNIANSVFLRLTILDPNGNIQIFEQAIIEAGGASADTGRVHIDLVGIVIPATATALRLEVVGDSLNPGALVTGSHRLLELYEGDESIPEAPAKAEEDKEYRLKVSADLGVSNEWTEAEVVEAGESRELVVLAQQRVIDQNTGVENLQFPAEYPDYKNYEITVADSLQILHTIRGTTSELDIQTDADAVKFAIVDNDESGSRQWLTWTPSTRTWGRGRQTDTPRIKIVSARLYDGGPKGEKGNPGDKGDGISKVLVANEAAYNSIAAKDADTLYYWPRA